MDPVIAKMAAQMALRLARSRGSIYLVVALVVTGMLATVATVFGPWMLTTEIAASMRGRGQAQYQAGAACAVQVGDLPSVAGMSPTQIRNAKIIWTVALQMSAGQQGAIIGIATALQESTLRNLHYGDRDSLGLFQQRRHWGSVAVREDPVKSSRLFFAALLKVKGWRQMSVAMAAQSVQRSAYPTAYANQEKLAASLVTLIQSKTQNPPAKDTIGSACGDRQVGPPAVHTGRVVLPESHYVLTARFGQCSSHWANCHTGLDFADPTGTPIHAVMDGKVIWTGWGGAYGNLTKVKDAGNIQTWYAHQSAFNVKIGQTVAAGQTIGRVGATGNTTGPHVHLEVRLSDVPVDPYKWLVAHGVTP